MRKNKQHLTTSDLQLQFILDASPVGMLVFNDREEIIAANPPAERLFGHFQPIAPPPRCGDFIRCANRLRTSEGCGHSDFCPSCLLFHSLRATLAGTATSADREGETRLVREPGCEPLWIRYKISPLALNGLRGALLTVDDITAQRHSEQQYAQLFREMLNAFALHEILCDELGNPVDYRFVAVNPAFERMTGLHAAQVTGRTILNVLPGTEPHWITTYGQVALTGQPIFFENYSREVGKHFSVHAFSPAPGQFACLFEDITERKLNEKERKRLQAQLAQAQKLEAIGTLAGGIAHDFNNVLGAVLGYAEMARDSSPHGSTAVKDLDKVLEAGHRAASLVKQILAFSRQSASERAPLDPSLIVKEVCRLLRPSLPSTIDIRQHTAATRLVLADPTQMHQILMNLCTNAFHAMEQTGGVLEITLGECELTPADLDQQPGIEPGGFIVLSVADTGPGITPTIRERMFDPYFTTKGVGQGTGMGLAIVHGIAAEYGGFVTCESEPGRGAIFRVFLPAIHGETLPENNSEECVPTGRERILLVDDEEMLTDMGRAMLERLGYEVTIHTSSLEALAAFQSEPDRFDAVITDQTMPEMTGVELAREMLRIRPGLPVILCTGFSNLVNEAQAKSYGIKGFALKPLTKKTMATLLRKVLNTQEGLD